MTRGPNPFWTPPVQSASWAALNAQQRTEAVRQAVQVDMLSFTDAAKRLETSRGAIAGIVKRSKKHPNPIIPSSHLAPKPPKKPKLSRRAEDRQRRARQRHSTLSSIVALPFEPASSPVRADAWQALPGTAPVPLYDLLAHGACKWPTGTDDAPFLFCAAPVREGSVYCSHHHAVAFRSIDVIRSKKR